MCLASEQNLSFKELYIELIDLSNFPLLTWVEGSF